EIAGVGGRARDGVIFVYAPSMRAGVVVVDVDGEEAQVGAVIFACISSSHGVVKHGSPGDDVTHRLRGRSGLGGAVFAFATVAIDSCAVGGEDAGAFGG